MNTYPGTGVCMLIDEHTHTHTRAMVMGRAMDLDVLVSSPLVSLLSVEEARGGEEEVRQLLPIIPSSTNTTTIRSLPILSVLCSSGYLPFPIPSFLAPIIFVYPTWTYIGPSITSTCSLSSLTLLYCFLFVPHYFLLPHSPLFARFGVLPIYSFSFLHFWFLFSFSFLFSLIHPYPFLHICRCLFYHFYLALIYFYLFFHTSLSSPSSFIHICLLFFVFRID